MRRDMRFKTHCHDVNTYMSQSEPLRSAASHQHFNFSFYRPTKKTSGHCPQHNVRSVSNGSATNENEREDHCKRRYCPSKLSSQQF